MTVINNLSRAGGLSVTDHAVSSAGWLSGAIAKQTEAEDIRVGVTIDQILAKHIGQDTPFPSLEFATEDFAGYIGGCVPGYSCTYMNTISWASETEPLPMEINPRVAFERMFGRAGTPEQRHRRSREDQSILDSIVEEARALHASVSAPIATASTATWTTCARSSAGSRRPRRARCRGRGVDPGADRHSGVVRRAHAVDVRLPGRGISGGPDARVHVHDRPRGQPAHVSGARHERDPSRHVAPRPVSPRRWRSTRRSTRCSSSLFAEFIEKLAGVAGRRRLDARPLDDRVRSRHERRPGALAYPLAFATVGSAGGRIRGNRYVIAPEWSPIANLWLGVAGIFGSPIESIGESKPRFETEDDRAPFTLCGAPRLRSRSPRAIARRARSRRCRRSLQRPRRGDQAAALELVEQGRGASTTPRPTARLRCTGRPSAATRSSSPRCSRPGADPNAANRYGMTPAHLAAVTATPSRCAHCSRPARTRTPRCPKARPCC